VTGCDPRAIPPAIHSPRRLCFAYFAPPRFRPTAFPYRCALRSPRLRVILPGLIAGPPAARSARRRIPGSNGCRRNIRLVGSEFVLSQSRRGRGEESAPSKRRAVRIGPDRIVRLSFLPSCSCCSAFSASLRDIPRFDFESPTRGVPLDVVFRGSAAAAGTSARAEPAVKRLPSITGSQPAAHALTRTGVTRASLPRVHLLCRRASHPERRRAGQQA